MTCSGSEPQIPNFRPLFGTRQVYHLPKCAEPDEFPPSDVFYHVSQPPKVFDRRLIVFSGSRRSRDESMVGMEFLDERTSDDLE
jgi:hypothetical protein